MITYARHLAAPDPLGLFAALYPERPGNFLYESLAEHGGRGRYSFLGGRPVATLTARGPSATIADGTGAVERLDLPPLEALRRLLARFEVESPPLPGFPGGAVGYLGWDVARALTPLGPPPPDRDGLPDAVFLVPSEVVVIDHLDEVVHVAFRGTPRAARAAELGAAIRASSPPISAPAPPPVRPRPNLGSRAFRDAVLRAKAHIREGDVYQIVLSRRFDFETDHAPLAHYARLRRANPSPYMYFLALDGFALAGSSPEVLIRRTGRRLVSRPLAGTRRRGADPREDDRLAAELTADPKERAEHVMLVDLARNDLGRIAEPGSVRVESYLGVERHAGVMHLTSSVTARLAHAYDAIDVITAAFPAGTVSGAPKIRAMQLIDAIEPSRRGPYAGAIGYVGFDGDLDLCIAIRTLVLVGRRGWLHAGAGIVADSDPASELRETRNKARRVLS